jgi:hypothetical protein
LSGTGEFLEMKYDSLKKGWLLILVNGVYALIYGFVLEIFTLEIIENNVLAGGVDLTIFNSLEPILVNQYMYLLRSNGYLLIALGTAIMYIALTTFRTGSRLAWISYSSFGGIMWFGLLYSDLSIGNIVTVILDAVGFFTYIFGVIIPMRSVLLGKWAKANIS